MLRKKGFWIALLLIVLVGGGGYLCYDRLLRPDKATSDEPELRTATVRRGDLVLYASGVGTIIPAWEVKVAFPTGSVVTELTVQVGDVVEQGAVLARVDDTDAQQSLTNAVIKVTRARLELEAAQETLDDLLAGGSEAERLDAQAALLAAQDALEDLRAGPTEAQLAAAEAAAGLARETYERLVNGPTAREIEEAELNLSKARNNLWSAQANRDAVKGNPNASGGQKASAEAQVANAQLSVRQAEITLEKLREPATEAEIADARAKLLKAEETWGDLREQPVAAALTAAQAQVAQTEEWFAQLTAPTEEDLAAARRNLEREQLDIQQAELDLAAAQRNLAETVVVAPFDGTVTAVTAVIGEKAAANTHIVLAETRQPLIEVYVDETDMDMIAIGHEAEVILDALPDDTFSGYVVAIEPSLVTVAGVSLVRALISLDETSFGKPRPLMMGLNASVDVIGGRAENALLVPVEALREIEADEYVVFVVENGDLKLRTVEVGLMDYGSAEIRSGLRQGELVSTGLVETSR